MKKWIRNYDFIFVVAMLAGLFLHLSCIYGAEHFADESFYPTVPLRLMNGDSLVSDEWHLTQFLSLFLYIPVRIYMAIKGTTDGIIVFLRFFYLVIHTVTAVGVYAFFRKHKLWAVGATLLFYTHVPLRFLNANYHSLLAISLLLFTFTLLGIYKKPKTILYISAGFLYGCCCVCNPFECFLFGVYAIICIIWRIKVFVYNKKLPTLSEEDSHKLTEKIRLRDNFFGKKAFVKFFIGLCAIAVISIVFYFATGGTLTGLLMNIPNLLTDDGHNISLEGFVQKIGITAQHFNTISFNLPFLLPLFYIVLLIDKKRRNPGHRLFYLIVSILLAFFYTVSTHVYALKDSRCLALSLPFAIVSTTCYILTENKNKKLFYCMWLPGLIANIVQYLASDLHLSTMWVLTVSNIAGVFFLKDFIAEIKPADGKNKSPRKLCQTIICLAICLQLVFQCGIYTVGRTVNTTDYKRLEKGPYAGLLLKEADYNRHHSIMNDLDIIKSRTNADDPVWIISEFSWMYLYIERPFGTYSAWQPFLELDRILAYYGENPDKIPKYVYICWEYIPASILEGHVTNLSRANNTSNRLMERFDCTREDLSRGILLTFNYQ